MTTSNTTTTKPAYRGKQGSKPTGKRPPRKMSPSLEEAIKLVKPLRGRDKIFGMLSTNDRGMVTEIGVYNGNTKKYALYRAELVDSEIVSEFKTIIS